MNTTVLESILQLLQQDLTATVAVAVGLAVVLAVLARVLWGAVLTDEPTAEPISDGGTTSFANAEATQDPAKATEESDEELEHRLDELETEVDSLSSTVKTVRNENEQISESVQDIEANTGRLLNLYKMATRGANPFANDASEEPDSAAVRHDQTDEEFSKEDEIEEIETEVADDSATELFDSPDAEIREEHCVDSVEEVVASGNEPEDAFQRKKQAERSEPDESGTEESIDDEFEAVFETKTPVETDTEDGAQFGTEEMIDTDGRATQAASDGGQLLEPTDADVSTPDTTTSTESAVESGPEPDTEPVLSFEMDEAPTEAASTSEPSTEESEMSPAVAPGTESPTGSPEVGDGKPYVESLPENISTELMTVEWLEYLVEEVGIRGTVRALEYYETIGWLTEEAVEELDEYLAAFEEPDQEELSVEHHLRSLDYVEELQHASEE
ncbi:FlaD/FlaE family flagellar protein [Halovenus halobia]|uniref:FlaD/FlaE family flagellar protein n=1 Tax=Halovenus halobia TaxID=3396622 RepID=UPI003F56C7A0